MRVEGAGTGCDLCCYPWSIQLNRVAVDCWQCQAWQEWKTEVVPWAGLRNSRALPKSFSFLCGVGDLGDESNPDTCCGRVDRWYSKTEHREVKKELRLDKLGDVFHFLASWVCMEWGMHLYLSGESPVMLKQGEEKHSLVSKDVVDSTFTENTALLQVMGVCTLLGTVNEKTFIWWGESAVKRAIH